MNVQRTVALALFFQDAVETLENKLFSTSDFKRERERENS
jgi:hypothetical protein